MARRPAKDSQNRLLVNVRDSCRGTDAHTFSQATSNGSKKCFLKMGVVKSCIRSWSGPAARSTRHERLLRVEEETGDTVGSKRSAHVSANVETMIGHSPTGPFVKVLGMIPGIKKRMVPVFVQIHGQDEEVRLPLFPSSSFSTILSTVRREHCT